MSTTLETQKKIYRLRQVEGKTIAEIAKALKIGSNTVSKYAGPARQDVRYRKVFKNSIEEVDKFLKEHGKLTTEPEEKRRRKYSRLKNELKNSEKNKLARLKYKRSEQGKKSALEYRERPKSRKRRSETSKLRTKKRAKEKKILQSKNSVIITDQEQIKKLAKEKANNSLKTNKRRSTLYKIKRANDPSSWISFDKLQELKKKGVNPKIYKKSIAGDFSKEGAKKMRDIVESKVIKFLESGGDARYIPEFGHHIAINAVDESGQRVASGLTNADNIGLQDADINRTLGAKVDQRMLDGIPSRQLLKSRGFVPSLLGMATLPLWLMAPDKAQAMTDTGQQNISSAANKYLPQGLVDYAKNIGSKVDNYIGQSIPTNTMGGMQANIGQMLYEGAKQIPSEIAGLIDFVGKNPKEYLNPEKNLSFAERMRLMQSGRSY